MKAAVLAGCAAMVLAACGGSGSDGNDDDVSGGLTGDPIRVGFLDPSLAPDASPDVSAAATAAAEYVNNELGGIDGSPLELVVCETDNSAEKVLACANEFAGSDVVAVIDGFDKGSGAALPVLDSAGIPLVGGVPSNGVVNASQTSFYTGTDQAAFAIAPLLSFSEQDADRVVLSLPEAPTSHTFVDSFLTPIADELGLDFSVTYYDGASPDFAAVAATAKAEKAEVGGVVSMRDENQCTQMVQAFGNAGFDGTVLAGACTRFIEELGEAAAGAQVYSSIWLPQMSEYAPEEVQGRLADMQELVEKHNDGEPGGYYGYATFNTLVVFSQALTESGQTDFNPASVIEIMGSLKDFPTFLGPEITCDHSVWPKSSSCSSEMIIAEVQEDGSLEPVFDDVFLKLSPDQLPG